MHQRQLQEKEVTEKATIIQSYFILCFGISSSENRDPPQKARGIVRHSHTDLLHTQNTNTTRFAASRD